MKLLPKIALLVTATVAISSVVGVAASWQYAEGPVYDAYGSMEHKVATFLWEGAEELPDDVKGEHHRALIESLVNGENGMNTAGSEINKQIYERANSWWSWDTFGSMDVYDKDSMTEMFGLDTSALHFMVYFPDNTPNTRYIFTTNVDLGESGTFNNAKPNFPIGENIVFRL